MANICDYELHARGTRDAVDELVKDMCPPEDQTDRRQMARVFDAEVIDTTEHKDGTVTISVAGGCAWSALACMTRYDEGCYGYGPDKDWFIGIEDEVRERNLSIEVHGFEPGMGFMERIICTPERKLTNECFEAAELCYSPSDGDTIEDLDQMVERYDLTDVERKLLESGEYVVKSDMDFDEWTI